MPHIIYDPVTEHYHDSIVCDVSEDNKWITPAQNTGITMDTYVNTLGVAMRQPTQIDDSFFPFICKSHSILLGSPDEGHIKLVAEFDKQYPHIYDYNSYGVYIK